MKKIKDTATVLGVITLYAFLSISFILSPVSESKASSVSLNDFNSIPSVFTHESIQQQSDVENISNEVAEIRENEEDDKHDELFHFNFIPNSSYSLVALVHQRFKNNTSHFHKEVVSIIPSYILFCTYRI